LSRICELSEHTRKVKIKTKRPNVSNKKNSWRKNFFGLRKKRFVCLDEWNSFSFWLSNKKTAYFGKHMKF